jgi:thiamine biosynthesis lipoprotein
MSPLTASCTARPACAACCAALLVVAFACAPRRAHELLLSGETMGSTWSVKVVLAAPPSEELRGTIEKTITEQLALVDGTMSTYRDDSDLSRLNAAPAGVPVSVPEPLLEVLLLSERVSRDTEGAFDVTVGPLVEAWGFGPRSTTAVPPASDELVRLRERIGHHLLLIDPVAATVTKAADGVSIDLNAVAPGYAADRIAVELQRLDLPRHLVEVGGEIRAGGLNAEGAPWRIAIEKPEIGRLVQRVVPLRDASLATSGDYRNFYVHEGRRYSHEIDPRTLRPVTHSLASVTVVHPSAAEADALATALFVLGLEEAMARAAARNLPVLVLVHDGEGGIEERTSPAMDALLADGARSG